MAALWLCAVVGRDGRIPEVRRVETLSVGRRYLLRLPAGLQYDAMVQRAPELAAALGARSLQVLPCVENAAFVTLTEINVDPLPDHVRSAVVTARRIDLWQSLPFGLAEDGSVVSLTLPEHNLLLGGEPGSGKSVALSSIVAAAALDPRVSISLFDGKQVELAPWRAVATDFVGPDQEVAVEVLHQLRTEMDRRYEQLLQSAQRKIDPTGNFGLHLVVIDELAFYLRGGKKSTREEFAELLRDLVSRGRAAGIIVVAATQKPSHEVVPTWIRDLFAFRLAMRCSSADASDTILGSGWSTRGYSAASIDPTKRGVGYLLAEGGLPVLLKTPFLSDQEIAEIALRAAELRR
jgi:DNA segregation ATPase FtsK/SpoIIIE-like protein